MELLNKYKQFAIRIKENAESKRREHLLVVRRLWIYQQIMNYMLISFTMSIAVLNQFTSEYRSIILILRVITPIIAAINAVNIFYENPKLIEKHKTAANLYLVLIQSIEFAILYEEVPDVQEFINRILKEDAIISKNLELPVRFASSVGNKEIPPHPTVFDLDKNNTDVRDNNERLENYVMDMVNYSDGLTV